MLKKVITAFLCFYCVNTLAGRSSSGIDGTTKIAVSAFKEKRVAVSVWFSDYSALTIASAFSNVECIVENLQSGRGDL